MFIDMQKCLRCPEIFLDFLDPSYCATKSALNAYAIAYRCDVAHTPIRVTCISPGLTDTEFSLVRFKGDKGKADMPYNDIVPLNAGDVADQVIYATTRPRHVQIADIICYPTNSGHARYNVKRMGPSLGATGGAN